VLRVIFPWPNRRAVEAEAAEFGVDPLLLVAIVRQESVFDAQALSPAGARGLAQLLPGTAALTARGLDVTFYPEWITVPDLNLHLGAAHLQELLQRFGGRVDAAAAAYNAGTAPVKRWLERPGADDPDEFIELIPYQETPATCAQCCAIASCTAPCMSANQLIVRDLYGLVGVSPGFLTTFPRRVKSIAPDTVPGRVLRAPCMTLQEQTEWLGKSEVVQ